MDALNLFIPITKVDAAKRLVYGVATAEKEDRSGEICDYAGTKPLYEKWSGDIHKASDGKSLGNLRAMHGKVAAGKVTEITFNDDARQIEICAKVVDDAEWNKVEEGVYTGFSQGGSYVKRWKDEAGLQRYIADPVEVSLVDVPCLPTATFQMIKADGVVEEKPFKAPEKVAITNDQVAAKAKELAKVAGDETKWAEQLEAARTELEKAEIVAPPKVETQAVVETPAVDVLNDVEQVWKSKDGKTFKLKADALKHNEELAKAASAAKPLDDATAALAATLGKVDLSTEGRKDEAKAGTAMKDGSYPIDDKKSLQDAVQAFGRAKNKAATKRHIIKRAKALKMTDELPADWPGSTKKDDTEKASGVEKSVSLWNISDMATALSYLEGIEECVEMDSYWTDSANIPDDLKTRFGAALVEVGDIMAELLDAYLSAMSDEESSEAMARAALVINLLKAGARHSKGDTSLLQKAHDTLVELGADCSDDMDKVAAAELAKSGDLTKLVAENADLKASMTKAIETMTKASERIVTLEGKVEALEKQPMLGGAVQLQVVGKEDEGLSEIRKAAETGDLNAVATEIIKQSFGRPMHSLPGQAARTEQVATA